MSTSLTPLEAPPLKGLKRNTFEVVLQQIVQLRGRKTEARPLKGLKKNTFEVVLQQIFQLRSCKTDINTGVQILKTFL